MDFPSLVHVKSWKKRGRVYYILPVGVNNATTLIITKMKDRRKPDNCIVEHFFEVTARNKMYISIDYEQHLRLIT